MFRDVYSYIGETRQLKDKVNSLKESNKKLRQYKNYVEQCLFTGKTPRCYDYYCTLKG